MSRYFLSPAAQLDLEQIWDYTCRRCDVEQADEYLRELQRAIKLAAANPRIGQACEEIRHGYRKFGAGSHTLYYRETPTASSMSCAYYTSAWTSTATSDRGDFPDS